MKPASRLPDAPTLWERVAVVLVVGTLVVVAWKVVHNLIGGL